MAYALFEVPSGWLGDVFGPRKVLIRVALWWSFFVALTGMVGMQVGNYVLGGVGTAGRRAIPFRRGRGGSLPQHHPRLHNWFPYHQRGFAQGAVWMCGRLMGGLTPLVFTILVSGIPARQTADRGEITQQFCRRSCPGGLFLRSSALLGIIWCVVFALWFRNRPEEKPSVNAAELALIRAGRADSPPSHAGVPWGRILASPDLWLLWLSYACLTYGWWFYITYLPGYIEQNYHVPAASLRGAIYKGGPLWMGALGCIAGGFLTDWFIRRTGNRRWGRRLFGVVAHGLTALCFSSCASRPGAGSFFIIIALAGFCTDLSMASSWATCQDIGGRYAAIVAGFMNMIGNLGGTAATWIFGFVLERSLAAHAHAMNATVNRFGRGEECGPGARLPDQFSHLRRHVCDRCSLLVAHRRNPAHRRQSAKLNRLPFRPATAHEGCPSASRILRSTRRVGLVILAICGIFGIGGIACWVRDLLSQMLTYWNATCQ